MSKKDNVTPSDSWEFNEQVADCFENMLERSIPQYNVMRDTVSKLTHSILSKSHKYSHNILDIGCSDGLMIQSLKNELDADNELYIKYTGIDISEPMLDKARCRFKDDISNGQINILDCDLRDDFPDDGNDVVVSCLSIQFTPIEHRQKILHNIYQSLPDGGTFIMVEKVLGNTAELNELFVNNYYDMKRANGYSDTQIERKRLSLEGVLVPVTNDWNIELLKSAGFRQVDVFWRWLNFVGYIAIK